MNEQQSPTILIIDDSSELLLLRKNLLTACGYHVITCDNGTEGLLLANQKMPDIILLDVVMPGMNGLEVLKNLKANEKTEGIFVILISGQQTSSDNITQGLSLGADGYLTSPIPNKLLIAQLGVFLRQKENMDKFVNSKNKIKAQNEELKIANEKLALTNEKIKTLNDELSESINNILLSEKKYKLITENSTDVIWTMKPDGSYTYVSPSVEKLKGFTPAEMLSMQVGESLDPESTIKARELFYFILDQESKGIRHEKYPTIELNQLRKDGSTIWTEVIVTPLRNEKGELLELLGVTRNIGDRMHLQMQNQKNLIRYAWAQRMGKVGNWEYDIKTTAFWGSDEAKRIYNLPLNDETFLTEQVEGCIPEREIVHQALIDLIEKNKEYNLEFEIIPFQTNGRKIIHSKAELEKDADGRPQKVIGVIQDITERKKAEKALEESEQKFRSLTESSPFAIMIYQDDKWVYVNEAATLITEYDKSELLQQNFWHFVHPDFVDLIKKRGARRQNNQKTESGYEFKIISKSGKEKWVNLSGANLIYNGKPAGIISVIDITNRKEAELRLVESEERNRFLSDVSFEAIVVHKNGIILDTNKAFEKMTAYTKEEAVGQHIFKALLREEDLQIARENITKSYAKPYQVLALRKDGTTFPAEIEGRNIQRNNETLRIVSIRDISEKELARKALEQSESKYKMVVNNSLEGIFIVQDGKFVYANPIIEKISGYTFNQIQQLNFIDFVYEDDRKMIIENNIKRMQGELIPSYDFRIVGYDKKPKWVHLNATKISWDAKPAILCFITDIHDRKLAEKALMKSEYRFRTYVQSSPTAVYITNPQGEFTFANPAGAQMLGYSLHELLGKSINEILPESETNKQIKIYNELQKSGRSESTTIIFKKKDGNLIDAHFEAVKLSEMEYMAYCRDISDLINAERRLQAAIEELQGLNKELERGNEEYQALNEELEKGNHELALINLELEKAKKEAEESDKLKSLFLANMSHEIRTPMNGIIGFADLLKEPGLTAEEQKKYVSIIESSGERMLNIINDLIDISKIEAGQMELSRGETNVHDQIITCYNFFKPETDKKAIDFHYFFDKNLIKPSIYTDREKLYAVLLNLIKNAIKYTNRGSIEFGYHFIQPDGETGNASNQNNRLQFYVRDTGIGIAPEKQALIFERFIQEDTAIAKPYEGAGLGLSISKAYIQMLGGSIWVESAKGKGSTFYFDLPYVPYTKTETSENHNLDLTKEIVHEKKLKILIAEDTEYSDLYLTKLVKNFSKEILHADNGAAALEIAEQHPDIDLILMDIKMPVMDGYDATRKIREFNKEVIIIAQSAFALTGDREKAIAAGCNSYLTKPINKSHFMEEIKSFFND